MDFLTASNRKGLGDKVDLFDDGTLDANNKDIVVIGGGDTAMDCVRTAVRQKAKSVKCLYRRDKANMPGSAREVLNAEEEGVEFIWLSSPKKFIGNSKVESIEVNKMELGSPDSSGRKKPVIKDGAEFKLNADLVIRSLGFDPENLPKLFKCESLAISKWGPKIIWTHEYKLKGRICCRGYCSWRFLGRQLKTVDAAVQIRKFLIEKDKLKDKKTVAA